MNRQETQTLTPERVKRFLKTLEGDLPEAHYEVDTVEMVLNEPSATDVPERPSNPPLPGGIIPPHR